MFYKQKEGNRVPGPRGDVKTRLWNHLLRRTITDPCARDTNVHLADEGRETQGAGVRGWGAAHRVTSSPNAHPALMSPGEVRDTRASFHGTRRLGRTIAKFKTL